MVALCKSISISDEPIPFLAFSTPTEARAWLDALQHKLEQHILDRRAREEFLVTVHFEAKRAGLDPQMLLGVIQVLSEFRKYKVSTHGAKGLMQVQVPDIWAKRTGCGGDKIFDLRTNLQYGATMLRHFIDQNNGDLFKALNAYQKESDPTAKADTPDFPNAVLAAWKNWEYRP